MAKWVFKINIAIAVIENYVRAVKAVLKAEP